MKTDNLADFLLFAFGVSLFIGPFCYAFGYRAAMREAKRVMNAEFDAFERNRRGRP